MSRQGTKRADSRFFSTSKKGENHELKQELNSQNRDRKKDAVKKVIANMTVGKDVSSLFTEVVNCIQTESLELKKLVYLYLINYAKSRPEQALLAVNTFVRDAQESNPLIRALAIRTMGCIRVAKITEYLCDPLTRCLRDEDPYVRKTAAVCVAKLYDISPELCEDRGFIEILRDLIRDANPTVVANAVAALSEIAEASGRDIMAVDAMVLQKLLAALNECTEWGQVFILDSLAVYVPSEAREAEGIIERVAPRLQHANSAVVMSAVKVILNYMEFVTNTDTLRQLSRKLAPPLVTLLNSEPEVQYVALRNINLIVQKRPKILEHEIKVFFCKYNDPIYVKMEKLEIIIRLVNERNVDQVLLEFKEYATEVDVDFVRRAVRAIGRCAIKLDRAAERCITALLDLIQTGVNYVVQEAVIVIKDIFRKYPNRYESIIGTLCENLETLDEPEAKASMIWIVGEYAERIDNADELIESFLESFHDETSQVQLQLLTAVVKLFLKQPDDTQDMVQRVLAMATEDSDNPDLRDRGYLYWRLLSLDPEAARGIVLAEKPTIADDTFTLEPALLSELMRQIGMLSSVYHKPADAFVMRAPPVIDERDDDEEDDEDGDEEYADDEGSDARGEESKGGGAETKAEPEAAPVDLLDIDDLDDGKAPEDEALGGGAGGGSAGSALAAFPKTTLTTAEAGAGVAIQGALLQRNGELVLDVDVMNQAATPVTQLAVQFNKSSFGFAPKTPTLDLPNAISNGAIGSASLGITLTPQMLADNAEASPTHLALQVAIKNISTNHIFYFTAPVNLCVLFSAEGGMTPELLANAWGSMDDSLEKSAVLQQVATTDLGAVRTKLLNHNIHFVATRDVGNGQTVSYFAIRTLHGRQLLAELTFKTGVQMCKVAVKSPLIHLSEATKNTIGALLASP